MGSRPKWDARIVDVFQKLYRPVFLPKKKEEMLPKDIVNVVAVAVIRFESVENL